MDDLAHGSVRVRREELDTEGLSSSRRTFLIRTAQLGGSVASAALLAACKSDVWRLLQRALTPLDRPR